MQEGLSRIALVEEPELGGDRQAVIADAPFQAVELAGDGLVFDLPVPGDPGVEGGAHAGGDGHEQAPEQED
jgi:hypothetical protein